jgi:hypothetical protein
MTQTSANRIEFFVDDFIRSRRVEALTSERDSDFINEPERAARVATAAEFGADGKTHAEVIGDWRDAFSYMMQDRERANWRRENSPLLPERFIAAVNAHFDRVEAWHEAHGSLFQEIG